MRNQHRYEILSIHYLTWLSIEKKGGASGDNICNQGADTGTRFVTCISRINSCSIHKTTGNTEQVGTSTSDESADDFKQTEEVVVLS
jgi:hypothetical protein